MGPRGKAALSSASLAPRGRAASRSVLSDQPSKGTWPAARRQGFSRAGFRCASRRVFSLALLEPMFRLAFEDELREVGHALAVEYTVQMVDLVLDHAGVEALGHTFDRFAVETSAAVADVGRAFDPASEAGTERQPSQPPSLSCDRISISGLTRTVSGAVWSKASASLRPGSARWAGAWKITRRSELCGPGARRGRPHSRRSWSRSCRDRRRSFRAGGVGDLLGTVGEDRMAHSGDLPDGHGPHMSRAAAGGKGGQRRTELVSTAPHQGCAAMRGCCPFFN